MSTEHPKPLMFAAKPRSCLTGSPEALCSSVTVIMVGYGYMNWAVYRLHDNEGPAGTLGPPSWMFAVVCLRCVVAKLFMMCCACHDSLPERMLHDAKSRSCDGCMSRNLHTGKSQVRSRSPSELSVSHIGSSLIEAKIHETQRLTALHRWFQCFSALFPVYWQVKMFGSSRSTRDRSGVSTVYPIIKAV